MNIFTKFAVLAIVAGLAGWAVPSTPASADTLQLAQGKGMGKTQEMRGKAEKHMNDAKEKMKKDKAHDEAEEMQEKAKKHGMKGRENAMQQGEGKKKGLKRMMGK